MKLNAMCVQSMHNGYALARYVKLCLSTYVVVVRLRDASVNVVVYNNSEKALIE